MINLEEIKFIENYKVHPNKIIKGEEVLIAGENFQKISNVDRMRPFFMSLISNSNHWLFISSSGGLTAGRKHSSNALFPYYTDDKIVESAENSGSKTIFIVSKAVLTIYGNHFPLDMKDYLKLLETFIKTPWGTKSFLKK